MSGVDETRATRYVTGEVNMHPALEEIPDRIIETALAALTQANTLAVFHDPGMEHRDHLCILSAALAGELFIKAIIAKEHPLLIFRDLFHLDQHISDSFLVDDIILGGRTYSFEHLPKLLWVTANERIDLELFDRVKRARNAVQHFCTPDLPLRRLSLEFLYLTVDPLASRHFGINCIEYHEDHVGYDYIVSCLLGSELPFSIPDDFVLTEIRASEIIDECSRPYREGFGLEVLERLKG